MNRIFILTGIIITTLIMACQSGSNGGAIPEDLEGKKKYLASKKSELKELQKTIDNLTKEIHKLDPPKEKPATQVLSMIVQPKEFKRFKEVEAQVVAEDIVSASSDIGGRILQLNVKEGQYVQKGSLIAVTDMETLEKQKDEILTSLNLATTVFERQKRLWDQNIGSELQYLQAKSQKEQLEKSLETLNSQMKKKNVYAPISGVVDREFLKQGEIASPGMPIVQILNTSKVKIVADLQEDLLGSVKKGDFVDVKLPALDLEMRKRISMIGRSIDPSNRTFKIEIDTDSQRGKLKPNLLALVQINDFNQSNALYVPLDVIQEEVTGEKFIYKATTENGKKLSKKTYVVLGESSDGEVIISSGIEAGDEIVVKGGKQLSENSLIETSQIEETDE